MIDLRKFMPPEVLSSRENLSRFAKMPISEKPKGCGTNEDYRPRNPEDAIMWNDTRPRIQEQKLLRNYAYPTH